MDEKEIGLVAERATEAAKNAAQKVIDANNVKVTAEFESLKKTTDETAALVKTLNEEVKAGNVALAALDGKVMKVSKGFSGISIARDLGAGAKECGFDKFKMYRGIATNKWAGADMELEIMKQVQTKAVSAGVATDGGYAMFEEMSSSVVELLYARDPFKDLKTLKLNMSGYSFKIPRVDSGSSAYWVGEAKGITESDLKFGLVTIEPRKVAAIVYVSKEAFNAGGQALVQVIENDMVNNLVKKKLEGFLYGNGQDAQPLGLTNMTETIVFDPTADTNGTDPSSDNLSIIRDLISEDYISDSKAFLGNRSTFSKTASLISAIAPEAAAVMSRKKLIENAYEDPYVMTSIIRKNKTKGSGTKLSDLLFAVWNEVVEAYWWGGMTIESTTVGANTFTTETVALKVVLPCSIANRSKDTMVYAPFMKTL